MYRDRLNLSIYNLFTKNMTVTPSGFVNTEQIMEDIP